ncbi:type VII secretion protein EssB [Leifsonia sp. AG29]|uniref:type VII secretion protein EssB n=1 Tax=Leifsonia sp. AG29 TaxID=2598860 RepID=UPI00131CBB18|nr:type VII secretion protein EssB [Leifsonia sp. AG29]
MRTEMNDTRLEFHADKGVLRVAIPKGGYDAECLDVIARYADATETDTGLVLAYPIRDEELSFREAVRRTTSRLDRLTLAQRLAACVPSQGGFRVPAIHPDNIYVHGDTPRVVHWGLERILAPDAFDADLVLRSLKAMVLQIFRPNLAFEHLLDGGRALRDPFSASIWEAAGPGALLTFLDEQLRAERAGAAATRVSVPKRRYSWYRGLGVTGVALGLAAGVFAWQAESRNRLSSSVIAAQAHFVANDFAGALTALEGYQAGSLPASAKYVLAVSSIQLDDLTTTQKQAILNTISAKSDDVTLSYWIAVGRGEFEQALDFAQNLGDDQLTLLAYTDLYHATELDTRMAGEKKQQRLEEYAKAIDDLTAKLAGAGGGEAPR